MRSQLQEWIHPRLSAAAEIIFHIKAACWQRAGHSLPVLLSLALALLLPLFTPPSSRFMLLPSFLLSRMSGAVISGRLPQKMQGGGHVLFDDIILATYHERNQLAACACTQIQILLPLLNTRAQLQTAAQEASVTMVLSRPANGIHSFTPCPSFT